MREVSLLSARLSVTLATAALLVAPPALASAQGVTWLVAPSAIVDIEHTEVGL